MLSGSPLSREQRTVDPRGTDVFLVSEPGLNRPDAFFYQSKHLTYDTLRKNIYQDISAGLHLGSMAFQDEADYALAGHDHFPKYVKAEFKPTYARNPDMPEKDDTVIVVGHIMINGRPYDMCIPKIRQEDVKVPEKPIGLLKFVAWPRLPDIDENASDFDGWTYPDGRAVSKARFPNAYAVFGNSFGEETDTQFRIPDIRDFMELNPYVQQQNPLEKKQATAGLPSHVHVISDITLNGSVSFDLSLRGYNRYATNEEYGPSGLPPFKYHHGTVAGSGSYVTPNINFSARNLTLHTNGLKEN